MPSRDQFKTSEEYNAYFRKYRKKNIEKMRNYNKEYNRRWRKVNGYYKEENWKKSNPDKVKAQRKAQRAVKSGKLIRRGCNICGKIDAVMHHPSYDKPLEVIWLCKPHHRAVHYSI